MSEDRVSRVSVRLLDREYQVACPSEERADLLDSAEYLDAQMREVRDGGMTTSTPTGGIRVEPALPRGPR